MEEDIFPVLVAHNEAIEIMLVEKLQGPCLSYIRRRGRRHHLLAKCGLLWLKLWYLLRKLSHWGRGAWDIRVRDRPVAHDALGACREKDIVVITLARVYTWDLLRHLLMVRLNIWSLMLGCDLSRHMVRFRRRTEDVIKILLKDWIRGPTCNVFFLGALWLVTEKGDVVEGLTRLWGWSMIWELPIMHPCPICRWHRRGSRRRPNVLFSEAQGYWWNLGCHLGLRTRNPGRLESNLRCRGRWCFVIHRLIIQKRLALGFDCTAIIVILICVLFQRKCFHWVHYSLKLLSEAMTVKNFLRWFFRFPGISQVTKLLKIEFLSLN